MNKTLRTSRAILLMVLGLVAHILVASPASGDDLSAETPSLEQPIYESSVDEFLPSASSETGDFVASNEDFAWDPSQNRLIADGRDERLIDRITDPTSWLMDIRFRQHWTWPVEPTDPDSQAIQFRPTIPFVAWDHVNLLRVTVPYDLQGADGAGLGDIQIFDLVVFDESWGRWGIGPSVRLIPDSGTDDSAFQAGPAAGAVTKSKHWTVGLLTQNFLGDGGSQSRIQPILAFKFDDRTSIGIGESEFRYDWDDANWTQLPLGIQADHIADVHGQKLQFFINPQYNFQRDASNSGWTLFLGVVLLVPRA